MIKKSIHRFDDLSSDVLSSDMNTFSDKLKQLIFYFLDDEFFHEIHEKLMTLMSFDECLSKTRNGSMSLVSIEFPIETEKRLSIMYQLLFKIDSNEIDLMTFVDSHYAVGSNQIDDFYDLFNRYISSPLFRELRYKLQDVEERVVRLSRNRISFRLKSMFVKLIGWIIDHIVSVVISALLIAILSAYFGLK